MFAAELSSEELMRTVNRGVVEKYRQSAVCLRFSEPVPLPRLEHLLCIRLSVEQQKRGEDIETKYKVLAELPPCGLCGSRTMPCRSVPNAYYCTAETCLASKKPVHSPHMIGVQQIKHQKAWHARYDIASWLDYESTGGDPLKWNRNAPIIRTAKVPVLSACLVVLDRNYDAEVLAAVYRSAGAIGEMLTPGWRLCR